MKPLKQLAVSILFVIVWFVVGMALSSANFSPSASTSVGFIIAAAVVAIVSHSPKCPHCGSKDTRNDYRISHDDHQPHLRFETTFKECQQCGSKWDHHTTTQSARL
jgi:transposase-like protein